MNSTLKRDQSFFFFFHKNGNGVIYLFSWGRKDHAVHVVELEEDVRGCVVEMVINEGGPHVALDYVIIQLFIYICI